MYRFWKIFKKIKSAKFIISIIKKIKPNRKRKKRKIINYGNQKIVISIVTVSGIILVSAILATLISFSQRTRTIVKEAKQFIMIKNHTLQDVDDIDIYVETIEEPIERIYIVKNVAVKGMKDKLLDDIKFPKISRDGAIKLDYVDKTNTVKTLYIVDKFSIDYVYNMELTIYKFNYDNGTFTFQFKKLE